MGVQLGGIRVLHPTLVHGGSGNWPDATPGEVNPTSTNPRHNPNRATTRLSDDIIPPPTTTKTGFSYTTITTAAGAYAVPRRRHVQPQQRRYDHPPKRVRADKHGQRGPSHTSVSRNDDPDSQPGTAPGPNTNRESARTYHSHATSTNGTANEQRLVGRVRDRDVCFQEPIFTITGNHPGIDRPRVGQQRVTMC